MYYYLIRNKNININLDLNINNIKVKQILVYILLYYYIPYTIEYWSYAVEQITTKNKKHYEIE